jgi:hypothetical protein
MNLSRAICVALVLGAITSFARAGLPVFKAEVAEPVVEELMGGCSLKCAFPWEVEVILGPGQKAQSIWTLNDNSAESGWVAPANVAGVGVKFHFLFPKKLPREMDGQVPLYGLDLVNGRWKDEESWKQYGRIKRARLSYNDRPMGEVTFADSRRWEKVSFPDIMVRHGDSMTLEVLEVYPGTKAGLAVSEIVLQGAH